ncbi:MAG: hypothetical protein R3324_02420, partial [Halobacteriales archaeon]|nr:hypothetical protein [Halobacteriales archaeon]
MAVGKPVAEQTGLLAFEPRDDSHGLSVIDRIERRHVTIETSTSIEPREASPALFEHPVGRAVTIETEQLRIPQQLGVLVHNSMGLLVADISGEDRRRFPQDRYTLDPGAPVKTYFVFDAAFAVEVSADGLELEFAEETSVHIGVRSHHKRPAGTITTTTDIDDIRRAISAFSSALKTTSCERSYPTLRGHPPAIELGPTLDIPAGLEPPETGVKLAVPDDLASVFASATLAYYLGAHLVPGDRPRLSTDTGYTRSLSPASRTYEVEAERVLKQVFFLDCLTRTEGLYEVNLHERNQLSGHIDLDFSELYHAPIGEQLAAYLEVPYDRIEPYFPEWKLTAYVEPDVSNVQSLPYLVNDLAVVASPPREGALGRRSTGRVDAPAHRGSNRSTGLESSRDTLPTAVRPEAADSIEQTWVGQGAPLGASKAMPAAFTHRIGRGPADHDIDITVVCNAPEMGSERQLVNDVYGSREELPFDIAVHSGVTAAELRTLLEEDIDFLHYIGHIDGQGFECVDGRLDASTLESTGVDVFFLNGCTSYEQGMSLIEAGSIAGIVTLQDVINSGAERVGNTLARLLNCGFPLRAAMTIARDESIMGGHYLVIGDGGIEIAQSEGGAPVLCRLEALGDYWKLDYLSYPTHEMGMGAITTPFIDGCDEYYLTSGHNGTFELTDDELA